MKSRRQSALDVRINAARHANERAHPVHQANGDERRIPKHAANYTKGLPHCAETGLVLEIAGQDLFELFVRGIDSGDPQDFRSTPLGPHRVVEEILIDTKPTRLAEPRLEAEYDEVSGWKWHSDIAYPNGHDKPGVPVRAWESASAGNTYDLEGPDAQAVTMPPAPSVDSDELTAEMGEVYCQALLRDIPFGVMRNGSPKGAHRDAFDQQVTALNTLAWFKPDYPTGALSSEERARRRAKLTDQTAFRGIAPGDDVGPYLSQFLLIGNAPLGAFPDPDAIHGPADGCIRYGAIRIDQRVRAVEKKDFMTTWEAWLDVQNGADLRRREAYECDPDTAYRFIATPRDLATYVHHDALYEAYLNACLILLAQDVPFDPGIPYLGRDRHDHQQGFAHFGGPQILTLVTEVATRALKAVRYQKFNVHRRLRPEALAARIEKADILAKTPGLGHFKTMGGQLSGILDDIRKLNESDTAHAKARPGKGTALLPMAFPEGSPMHPAYGAGHATVAGACVTILKAFFDHSREFKPAGCSSVAFIASDDGKKLEEVEVRAPDPAKPGKTIKSFLTVEGELNKLAANISIGRDWAGVHYFTDYWESIRMGEQIALGILEEQKLTYGENFSMTVPLFGGGSVRI